MDEQLQAEQLQSASNRKTLVIETGPELTKVLVKIVDAIIAAITPQGLDQLGQRIKSTTEQIQQFDQSTTKQP